MSQWTTQILEAIISTKGFEPVTTKWTSNKRFEELKLEDHLVRQ